MKLSTSAVKHIPDPLYRGLIRESFLVKEERLRLLILNGIFSGHKVPKFSRDLLLGLSTVC